MYKGFALSPIAIVDPQPHRSVVCCSDNPVRGVPFISAILLIGSQHSSLDALTELSETQFDNWAKPESFEIAKEFAYRNGTLSGSPDKDSAEVLPADYASSVKGVAERRAVLAGYRIADLLQQSF